MSAPSTFPRVLLRQGPVYLYKSMSTSHRKMNLVTFGLILFYCNAWAAETNVTSKPVNKMLGDFLEKFKTMLKTGNETLGIPVLDPLIMDRLDIKLNKEKIRLGLLALLTKVNVTGLSEYDIIEANYMLSKEIPLKLNLSWPLIAASTNYSIKGKFDDFVIYGTGDIKMSAENFSFDMEIIFLKDNRGHLKVKNMKLKLSLKSLDFHATGLYDDDELSTLMSAIISDMAPELLSDDAVNEIIVNKIIPVIVNQLDSFLSTMTVIELLRLVLYV